ncbi:unnamed protein product [Clavelina lepadiformis]|uniref:G-protein coupled receptors family 1 profile domain-containing protein n=1 Tax=Clavelina lepadiformis TaxID=159417 RepID=A0ABP0FPS8_CLALP
MFMLLLLWFMPLAHSRYFGVIENCYHHSTGCQPSEFNCNCEQVYGRVDECIPWSWVCDAWTDCSNGRDEKDCKCPPGFFQCGCDRPDFDCQVLPQCIVASNLCNSLIDCYSGRDELGTQCKGSEYLTCDKGWYYQQSDTCNKHKFCLDGKDEENCQFCPPDRPYQCPCSEIKNDCEPLLCYGEKEICDSVRDCPDGIDESDCSVCPWYDPLPCACNQVDNFTCPKGEYICYSEHGKCNGEVDCEDGSDEWDCDSCPNSSSIPCACNQKNNFTCSVPFQSCYSLDDKCDGFTDCSDNSDEWNCTCLEPIPTHCACHNSANFTCLPGLPVCYNIEDVSCSYGYPQCSDKSDRLICKQKPRCLSAEMKCDGYADCFDGEDEQSCDTCPRYITEHCACHGKGNYTCKGVGRVCYKPEEACDGDIDCVDGSDEWDCSSCPSWAPFPCACKETGTCFGNKTTWTCYNNEEKCDSRAKCKDGSDETNCSCPDDLFACSCYSFNAPTCSNNKGCIATSRVNDGIFDCDSRNDEVYITGFFTQQCGSCNLDMMRFSNKSTCRLPQCDNTTCYDIPPLGCLSFPCNVTDHVCTSPCTDRATTTDCRKAFQCSDQDLILNSNFCNGKLDCEDGSDEIINGPGFKCSTKFTVIPCILPQWNLYDNVAQCYDKSDLCFGEDGSFHCFKCLDNRLIISPKQLCDGEIDCYDMSDECLCENILVDKCINLFQSHVFKSPFCNTLHTPGDLLSQPCSRKLGNDSGVQKKCKQNSVVQCQTKWGLTYATKCDKRPECIDFSDECHSCADPPTFCNDTCHDFYNLGDRYCNGYEDQAWMNLNRTDCPQGFDEHDCPMRHECKAGDKVSIDKGQKCNGIADCDDRSDEKNCDDRYRCDTVVGGFISIPVSAVLDGKRDCVDGSDEFVPGIFSSRFELIGNDHLRRWFWIVAIVTVLGNVFVIFSTLRDMTNKDASKARRCNKVLILNLSVSDLLMGIYLLIITGQGAVYAGNYAEFDYEWRSGTLCSIAGSICMISSETSCFIMVLIGAFRHYSIFFPFKARLAKVNVWKVAALFSWLLSITLAILPNLFRYFNHAALFLSPLSKTDTVADDYVISFACRLSMLTNTSMQDKGDAWLTAKSFLDDKFPQLSPSGDISYYGKTSVCIPTLFVTQGDKFWPYSTFIITLNLASFMFVCVSYVLVYNKLSKRPDTINDGAANQDRRLHLRIARLIVTDFVCWIPICIMAYVSLGGVVLSPGIEIFTAGVLLPINSALNPILYSSFIEDLVTNLVRKINSQVVDLTTITRA